MENRNDDQLQRIRINNFYSLVEKFKGENELSDV